MQFNAVVGIMSCIRQGKSNKMSNKMLSSVSTLRLTAFGLNVTHLIESTKNGLKYYDYLALSQEPETKRDCLTISETILDFLRTDSLIFITTVLVRYITK